MNTSIHILEALTGRDQVGPDPLFTSRLTELLDLGLGPAVRRASLLRPVSERLRKLAGKGVSA